jgi:hypothetical protein
MRGCKLEHQDGLQPGNDKLSTRCDSYADRSREYSSDELKKVNRAKYVLFEYICV